MGFHMVHNLRKKMKPDQMLVVADVSEGAVSRFLDQAKSYGPISVAKDGFEVAQQAVSEATSQG